MTQIRPSGLFRKRLLPFQNAVSGFRAPSFSNTVSRETEAEPRHGSIRKEGVSTVRSRAPRDSYTARFLFRFPCIKRSWRNRIDSAANPLFCINGRDTSVSTASRSRKKACRWESNLLDKTVPDTESNVCRVRVSGIVSRLARISLMAM